MKELSIAFIGAGNMAGSIIGGLVAAGHAPERIRAADPIPESLARVAAIAPIVMCKSNAEAAEGADVVILAVKPQVMRDASSSIAEAVDASGAVCLSIAAGVTVSSLEQRLGAGSAVVRCMPNTPALLGVGASGLYANAHTRPDQREVAAYILGAVGSTCWVEREVDLDAITALSGSGPAYFFLFMEAMVASGQRLGLDAATATQLATQTALGAARMAIEDEASLPELRRRVTSPGGTTEAAVAVFQDRAIEGVVDSAMQAAFDRAAELAREMG
ncbi:MAG: pyrroline-5-carboxylate reductase [Pseudomonadota bacterium]